jgi:hypothetical protein
MKGMRKIKRGSGFKGAVSYAINREPGDDPGQIIGGNMSSSTVKGLSAEFGVSRKLRPDIKKPVWHNALRLPPGEHVSPEKLVKIADDYMQRMGFADLHQRLYVMHDDKDGQHVHIVASRVALDSSLYLGKNENLESTRHIQALEKAYNLEITKGPTLKNGKIVMPEKSSPTQGQTEAALATNRRPDKLELQDLIDDALKSPCTAPEFINRLAVLGVAVRPNIAKTGLMNGFSFKLAEGGKPIAGSKIGDNYKWAKLQKRGVEYDKIRDSAELTQHCEQFSRDSEPVKIDQPGVVESSAVDSSRNSDDLGAIKPDQRGIGESTPIDSSRNSDNLGAIETDKGRTDDIAAGSGRGDSDGTGTVEADQPRVIGFESDQDGHTAGSDGIRRNDIGNAPDTGYSDDGTASADSRATEADQRQIDGNSRSEDDNRNGIDRDQDGNRRDRDDNRSSRNEAQQNSPQVVDDTSTARDISGPGRSNRNVGLSRFRKASASKRRTEERELGANGMEQSISERKRIIESDRVKARELDPTPYLESQGFTVKPEGRHMSVKVNGDEVYRVTCKPGGHYVTCDKYGNGIGDNIALVKEIEPGTRYADAIYKLHGDPTVEPRQRPAAPHRTPPRIPAGGPIEQTQGRNYLRGRGISQETITHAEKSGMIQYCDGGVLFVGRDDSGKAQNVTRRTTNEMAPILKRDLKGSDKQFAPILPGDPAKVWIVEGGADALALHDIAKRSNQPAPTVIVSGGANVRSFLENPSVQAIIKKAEKVTICKENEKNEEAKAKADAGHQKQADRVQELTGREPALWTPPPQDKDLAEFNVWQQSQAEQNRLKYEEIRQQTQEREQDLDQNQDRSGPSR